MFCSKCGKEIPDNVAFCTFCGEKTEGGVGKDIRNSTVNSKKSFLLLNSIISIVVAIAYVYISSKWFKSNREAFDWCDSSSESIGTFLHWAICILFCVQSFTFICLFNQKLSALISMKCGVLLIIEGIVLKVLEMLHNDWSSSNDMSIVFFRIFGRTYCNVVGVTIFMGILLIISGTIMKKVSFKQ